MRTPFTRLFIHVAFATLAAPALADETWTEGPEVINDHEMSELRGGLAVAPGLTVEFGARVTTFVGGVAALETHLTWTNQGELIEQSVGDVSQRIDALASEARVALGLDETGHAGGIVINDAQGITALVHNVTDGALQNIIVNTASGRDLRQEVDVTLTLPGFGAIQDSIALDRLGIRLQDDLQSVSF